MTTLPRKTQPNQKPTRIRIDVKLPQHISSRKGVAIEMLNLFNCVSMACAVLSPTEVDDLIVMLEYYKQEVIKNEAQPEQKR